MGYLSKLALRVDPGGAAPDVTASSASPAMAIAAEFLGGSSITVTRSAQAHRSFVTQLPLLVAVRDDAVRSGASAQDTYGLREGDRLAMLCWMAAQILRTPPSSDIITIERNRLGNDMAEALMIVNKSLRNEEVEKAAMSSGGSGGGGAGGGGVWGASARGRSVRQKRAQREHAACGRVGVPQAAVARGDGDV